MQVMMLSMQKWVFNRNYPTFCGDDKGTVLIGLQTHMGTHCRLVFLVI